MKLLREQIPHRPQESFHCEVVRGADYGTPWHFHPELELTLVLRSRGHRIVGDDITSLRPGDLVFLGPNVPHVWHQQPGGGGVHAVVIQFLEDFLGGEFLALPETEQLRRLFRRAQRGLRITGPTREAVARRMIALAEVTTPGWLRLKELIEILTLLAEGRNLKPIASAGFAPELNREDESRMVRVCEHIHNHLAGKLDRQSVAAVACLSVGAFSRFFKVRTGKTLPEFVNELRIGHACQLLMEAEQTISAIALECGFESLSNFNHRFRARTGVTPREYRKQAAAIGS